MIISYDGTQYSGWQIQLNAISIQELIQKALATILKQEVSLIGAGRTDAGVHARGQVAHFKIENELDLRRFLHSINGLLPNDIRVLEVTEVPEKFHAQKDASSKIYHYHLCLGRVQDPFKRLYSYHVRDNINIDLIHEAAKLFVGTHDFTSFSNEAHKGAAAKHAVRTIMRLDVIEEEGGLRLEFEGNGFLYKMVRNIVGTILTVAKGKMKLEEIPEIFSAKDRRQASQAAPAHGLFLMKVIYPERNKA